MQVGRCRNNGNAVVMPENEKKRENNTKKKNTTAPVHVNLKNQLQSGMIHFSYAGNSFMFLICT